MRPKNEANQPGKPNVQCQPDTASNNDGLENRKGASHIPPHETHWGTMRIISSNMPNPHGAHAACITAWSKVAKTMAMMSHRHLLGAWVRGSNPAPCQDGMYIYIYTYLFFLFLFFFVDRAPRVLPHRQITIHLNISPHRHKSLFKTHLDHPTVH